MRPQHAEGRIWSACCRKDLPGGPEYALERIYNEAREAALFTDAAVRPPYCFHACDKDNAALQVLEQRPSEHLFVDVLHRLPAAVQTQLARLQERAREMTGGADEQTQAAHTWIGDYMRRRRSAIFMPKNFVRNSVGLQQTRVPCVTSCVSWS